MTTTLSAANVMLATEGSTWDLVKYVEDDNYWMEPKLDGHRVLISAQGRLVITQNRNGYLSQHQERIEQVLRPYQSFVAPSKWDCEYVNGEIHVFDRISYTLPSIPFTARREYLEKHIHHIPPFRLVPCAKTHKEKAELTLSCLNQHAEGVIVKHKNGLYLGGRSPAWIKIKFVLDADLIVTDVGVEGKENAVLGAVGDGVIIEVGRASTWGKGEINVGDVVTVRYLYVGARGKLVQPRIIRKRTDKLPAECTLDQLSKEKGSTPSS